MAFKKSSDKETKDDKRKDKKHNDDKKSKKGSNPFANALKNAKK